MLTYNLSRRAGRTSLSPSQIPATLVSYPSNQWNQRRFSIEDDMSPGYQKFLWIHVQCHFCGMIL